MGSSQATQPVRRTSPALLVWQATGAAGLGAGAGAGVEVGAVGAGAAGVAGAVGGVAGVIGAEARTAGVAGAAELATSTPQSLGRPSPSRQTEQVEERSAVSGGEELGVETAAARAASPV